MTRLEINKKINEWGKRTDVDLKRSRSVGPLVVVLVGLFVVMLVRPLMVVLVVVVTAMVMLTMMVVLLVTMGKRLKVLARRVNCVRSFLSEDRAHRDEAGNAGDSHQGS